MEDVFYLNKDVVRAGELYMLIQQSFPRFELVSSCYLGDKSEHVAIDLDTTGVLFRFESEVMESNVWNALSEATKEKVTSFNIRTLVTITFRVAVIPVVLQVLQELLRTYGGYIACDDNWEVVYTSDTLSDLHCFSLASDVG